MNTMPIENQQKSLALGVACGRSVRSWARRHEIEFTTAYEWSVQKEFRLLVDRARLRVADFMVGRLVRAARLAIDQLVLLCTRSESDAVRLSASRALLTYWMKVDRHFVLHAKMDGIEVCLDERYKQKKTGVWPPNSP
jgi:hypothetical protein